MLVHQLAHLDHDVLYFEVWKAQLDIQTALELAHDTSVSDSPGYVAFTKGAHIWVMVVGVECFRLLLNRQLGKHLVELIVGLGVLLSIFDQLQGKEPVHILSDFKVDLIPLIDCQLWQVLLSFTINNAID